MKYCQTPRNHDGLVITVNGTRYVLFVATEVTREVRATEFIVEGCATERAINHDLQGRRDTLRLSSNRRVTMARTLIRCLCDIARVFPWLYRMGDHQIRYAETAQTCLWLSAAPSRTLITNLATGTR